MPKIHTAKIHGHHDVETFSIFFNHCTIKHIDCNQNMLIMGSDDKKH